MEEEPNTNRGVAAALIAFSTLGIVFAILAIVAIVRSI